MKHPPTTFVRDAKQNADLKAEVAAHQLFDDVKRALGERGPVWWKDGSPDLNRSHGEEHAHRRLRRSSGADQVCGASSA